MRRRKQNTWIWWLIATLFLGGLALGLYLALRSLHRPEVAPQEAGGEAPEG